MRSLLKLILLSVLWSGFSFAEVKIQILDSEGNPVENAVVSVPMHKPLSASQIAKMPPVVMDQVNKQFLPTVLLVSAGQTVVFPNSDNVRHHVYSFSKPNDFEIRLYGENQVAPLQFEYPGVVVLGCNIHDQMVGYLYVKENEVAHVSDTNGYVVFENENLTNASTEQVVTLWHSQLSNNKSERTSHLLSEKNAKGDWQVTLKLKPEVKKTSRKFKLRY